MIIIYYTDKDGKIVSCHGDSKQSHTLPKLEEMVQIYNQGSRDGKTAHIIETEDNSLTAYLFGKAMERKKWDEDTVQEAIRAIDNAMDAVRSLL